MISKVFYFCMALYLFFNGYWGLSLWNEAPVMVRVMSVMMFLMGMIFLFWAFEDQIQKRFFPIKTVEEMFPPKEGGNTP